MDYYFKKFSESRINDIIPLFRKAFDKEFSYDYIRDKYSTSIFGHDFLGFIAYSKLGQAVAFYGSIPHYIMYDGKKILVVQSSDAMTDPEHLRNGLFLKLAKLNFAFCKEIGVKFIYGFPNEKSAPGFKKKLEWEFKENMHVWVFNSKGLPFLWLKRNIKIFEYILPFYQKRIVNVLKVQPKNYVSCLMKNDQFGVFKDDAFLSYKLKQSNSLFLKIYDLLVWIKIDEMFLMVGDVETCSLAKFKKVIKKLTFIARILGIPHIRFNVQQNSKLSKMLESLLQREGLEYLIGYLLFDSTIDMTKVKFIMSDNDTF